jgi:hypothetical protein
MPEKAKQEFGKRRQVSVPPSPVLPPKRSNHVALLVMGTLAVGGTAYALMPRECTPAAEPGTMPTLSSPAECPPRGSSSSSHGGSGGSSRYSYYSGGSSGSTPAGTTDASSGTVRRGGSAPSLTVSRHTSRSAAERNLL